MKLTTTSLCLLVIGATLVAPSMALTPDCTDANHFVKWLKGVQAEAVSATALTAPAAGWEVCSTTWGNDGTCCNVDKLKGAFNKIAGEVKKGWGEFINGFKKFKDASKKVKEGAGGADVKTKVDGAKAKGGDFNGLTSDQAKAIMEKIDTLDAQLKTFKEKADTCFKAANQVRSNIFCSGCQTGAGFTLNGADLTYTFVSATCNTALEACVPVWSLMFNLQAQMQIAVEVRRAEKGSGDKPKGPPKLPRSKSFGDLATLFTSCPNGKVEAGVPCTQDNLDTLCGLFVSFKKPEPIAKPADDSDLQNGAPADAPPKRLLQSSTETDGTGVAGAGGISLNKEQKPMTADVSIDASQTGEAAKHGSVLIVSILGLVTLFTSI